MRNAALLLLLRLRELSAYCLFQCLAGLYPTGEGAGYAGGILSAALDGVRVATALSLVLRRTEA